MADSGKVNIHGKEYETVASRVQRFRKEHPNHTLETKVEWRDETEVVMKASISDETGRLIATGHAEEVRASSQINRTSALENAETSAIGRALAAFGMAGTEFASADEVATAITQQRAPVRTTAPTEELMTDIQKSQLKAFLIAMGYKDTADQKQFLYHEFGVTPDKITKAKAVEIMEALK